jgi:hypothetical protein
MTVLEMSAYIYLTITNQECPQGMWLSSFLLLTAVSTLTVAAMSLPLSFYYHHWISFWLACVLSTILRLIALVWIVWL